MRAAQRDKSKVDSWRFCRAAPLQLAPVMSRADKLRTCQKDRPIAAIGEPV